ncbi:hypothetical protein [Mesorhizobium delmotii]|uniref:Uncharacterized protein n=1 Tax=Mesorhizobium delmotii TaxID=1631247 RepID=A0A2P9ASJ2_9HYPH|nr:hypothetical protein [Mesorhizobium delmotii]SJM34139.1 hypothetical protein BQ8482_380322 [Mesorhizobium delmotii]
MAGSSLPPANPAALGLHMTSKQLAGLLVWLDEQQEIVERAWIFGSQFSGQRREKDTSNGPDVDLAVELQISPDGKRNLWLHELRHRLREFLDKNGAALDLSSNEGEANFVHLEFCIEDGRSLTMWPRARH